MENANLGEPALSGDHEFLVIIKKPTDTGRKRKKDALGESGCPCADWWRRVTQEISRSDLDARQNILLSESRFRGGID